MSWEWVKVIDIIKIENNSYVQRSAYTKLHLLYQKTSNPVWGWWLEMHFSDMKLPHIQSFTSMWGVVSDVLPDYWYVIHHMIEPPTTQLSGWLHFHIEVDRLLVT